MKRFLLLLSAVMLLPLCAFAVTTVPSGVTVVEDEAFAYTGIDALIIPASVQVVGANVLAGCNASYLYLNSASTTLASGAANGVAFVFGPANSSAAGLSGFYAADTLTIQDGLYYSVADAALPLCAMSPAGTSGTLTIPKLVEGKPVTSLSELFLQNTGVTEVKVPAYLTIPDGLAASPYQTVFVTAPTADKTTSAAGRYVTWTTSVEGAYGDVSYLWTFTVNGETSTAITSEPMVSFAPGAEGICTVTVTAEDSLGDKASAEGESVTVTAAEPVYRALLVANSYPGAYNALGGPENDLAAMVTMLNSMTGTKYKVTTAQNRTASSIRSAIASTFAGAEPGDVSLFYYSGHGNSDGSLVGTGDTLLSVASLRNALQQIPGKKIVILDCCYSGTVINRSADAAADEGPSPSAFNSAVISAFASASRSSSNLEDEGYIVLTSCRKDQTSVSLADATGSYFGVFTYGLCYGSGYDEWKRVSLGSLPADANGDGVITLGEAHTRINERVSYLSTMVSGGLSQATQYYGDSSFVLWRK